MLAFVDIILVVVIIIIPPQIKIIYWGSYVLVVEARLTLGERVEGLFPATLCTYSSFALKRCFSSLQPPSAWQTAIHPTMSAELLHSS